MARQLARLPQAALRSNRLSAIEQWSFDWQQAALSEFLLGVATIIATGEMDWVQSTIVCCTNATWRHDWYGGHAILPTPGRN